MVQAGNSRNGDGDHLLDIFVAIIPLPVQVIRHVDDVVDDIADLFDRKPLEVPVRRGRGDGHGLAAGKSSANLLQKRQIVGAVAGAARGNARDVRCAGVLPVEVDSIQIIVDDELRQRISKGLG